MDYVFACEAFCRYFLLLLALVQIAEIVSACGTGWGSSGSEAASFRDNRFILTGDTDGDYNAALAMVSDACSAPANSLLSRPSTVPHPAGATGQTTAVLPVGSTAYNAIASWISSGCTGP